MTAPFAFSVRRGTRLTSGVWGRSPHFLWLGTSQPYLARTQNAQKRCKQKNEQTKGEK